MRKISFISEVTRGLAAVVFTTLILSVPTFAQTQAQTWIELAPTGAPPQPVFVPKNTHYDAANNRLIAFYPGNPPFNGNPPGNGNEVWILTNANGLGGPPAWIKLLPSGSLPFSNGNETTVYDAATNRLIVYGGCFANCSPALANVFVLSNANGLGGLPVWSQSTVTNPQARAGLSAVGDSANNLMITFAGHLAFFGTDHNDVRILSNANGTASPSTWTTLGTSGGPPSIRAEHSAIYDQTNNRMTIFAGHQLISTCCPYVISDYNDAWVLSNANGQNGTATWTQLSPLGSLPAVRNSHSSVYDPANNRMIVFGGAQWNQAAQTSTPLGDLWQLTHANGLGGAPEWSQLSQSGAVPGPRFYHTAAFDSVNQRMIILGGRDQNDLPSNRVWILILNQAPTAVCQDITVSAGPNCVADASIDNGSFDPDGDSVTITQSPAGPYPLGTTNVTVTVTDSNGASSTCAATVTVVQRNSPPVANAGPDQTEACTLAQGAPVTLDGSGSSDSDHDSLSFEWRDEANQLVGTTAAVSPTVPVGSHTYTLTVNDGHGFTSSDSVNVTVNPRLLTAIGPANVWIGLKSSDDVGTRFDLLVEVFKDGTLVGSGQVSSVPGGSSGFNNARLNTIPVTLTSSANCCSGTLSARLSVRVASSGHRSGTARLWSNDAQANSNFSATIATSTNNYFLLDLSKLGTTAGPGPRKTVDVFVDRAVNGNPFKAFGTWTITLP